METPEPPDKDARLTPEEDAALRRLHYFDTKAGADLALPMQTLRAELRARDLRTEVREPKDEDVVLAFEEPEDQQSGAEQ